MKPLKGRTIILIVFIVVAVAMASFSGFRTDKEFSLGLDLQGGARLVYSADTTGIEAGEIRKRMESLRGVIERRVNAFGVGEPAVYTETSSLGTDKNRLVVELPGITNITEAVKKIGETPLLEFKLFDRALGEFVSTPIDGSMVVSSDTQFIVGAGGSVTNEPAVVLNFNSQGGRLFSELTRENVGEILGIFLDGVLISDPVIRSAIPDGSTQISGAFTIEEAQSLSRDLNFGALPLPISLVETGTIDASLGAETISTMIYAGIFAFILVVIFLISMYRLFGVLAAISLIVYIAILFTIFKELPVVLTAAGLAGFVMSLGFAVDANILVFERIREEFGLGRSPKEAIEIGFARAWRSIRDANSSSLIIAVLLFWFGTSLFKGFALTFGIGVIISMVTAFFFSRNLLATLMSRQKKYHPLLIPRKKKS